ncbi:MAG: IS30 family transposase [Pleomorphochaeta sp.]
MNNNFKHLSSKERHFIYSGLNDKKSFKQIAKGINRSPSTVSREVRAHMQLKRKGSKWSHYFNDCKFRKTCNKVYMCDNLNCPGKRCSTCGKCIYICKDYIKEECPLLDKPPYVCNGCKNEFRCDLEKRFYDSIYAQKQYKEVLVDKRSGISINEDEFKFTNDLIIPLVKKGQSFHHIYETHKYEIPICERTLYSYQHSGLFEVDNFKHPRLVRFKKRINTNSTKRKIDKKCRIGRTYEDYENFIDNHPDIPVVQMDSVEGTKGGKVLLTIHFVNCSLMLAYIRERNTAQSVIDIFNDLYVKLGHNDFKRLFPVILTDNGQEFSGPKQIEETTDGIIRTKVFFCEPMASWSKGSCEVNHELLRRVIPKQQSINHLDQEKTNLMMNHINSYKREKLGNNTPYEIFERMYGVSIINKLGLTFIQPDEVILRPNLVK